MKSEVAIFEPGGPDWKCPKCRRKFRMYVPVRCPYCGQLDCLIRISKEGKDAGKNEGV